MKIRKTATQKNFIVDPMYYLDRELENMVARGVITKMRSPSSPSGDYRIYASQLDEVKFILEDGYYTPVVITKNGEKVYIIA